MPTQVQIRGTTQATQEVRTLAVRELDVNTTDKRVSLHDGSTPGGIPHVNYYDQQNQEFTYAAATGTNSIAITLARAPSSYASGQEFSFKAANTITGSATLNVNSLGAKTIKKLVSGSLVALSSGDIVANVIYKVTYDGTDFQISGRGAGGGGVLLAETDASSSSVIDFGSSVISGYSRYEFHFSNILPDTDGADFYFRCSVDGGSSFSSASAYYALGRSKSNGAASADFDTGTTTEGHLNNTGIDSSGSGGAGLNGTFVCPGLINASGYKCFGIDTFHTRTDGNLEYFNGAAFLIANPLNNTAVDGFRFFMSSGNIASGKIKVYGY